MSSQEEYDWRVRGIVVNEAPPLDKTVDVFESDGALCFGYERFCLKARNACLSLCVCVSLKSCRSLVDWRSGLSLSLCLFEKLGGVLISNGFRV